MTAALRQRGVVQTGPGCPARWEVKSFDMPIIQKLRNGMFALVMCCRSTNGMTVDWSGKEIDYSYI